MDRCYARFADFFVFSEGEGDGFGLGEVELGGGWGWGLGVGLVEEVSEEHGKDLGVFESLGCTLSRSGLQGVGSVADEDCVPV